MQIEVQFACRFILYHANRVEATVRVYTLESKTRLIENLLGANKLNELTYLALIIVSSLNEQIYILFLEKNFNGLHC